MPEQTQKIDCEKEAEQFLAMMEEHGKNSKVITSFLFDLCDRVRDETLNEVESLSQYDVLFSNYDEKGVLIRDVASLRKKVEVGNG